MRHSSCLVRRRGFTLVELVAVMIAGSALMAVTVAAIVAMQRADKEIQLHANERQAVALLADRLRSDLHAAERIAWDEDARRLTLTQPDGGSVVYDQEESHWERSIAGAAENPRQLAGAYPVPRDVHWTVAPARAQVGQLASISWQAAPKSAGPRAATPRRQEVVAVVGRDLALVHARRKGNAP